MKMIKLIHRLLFVTLLLFSKLGLSCVTQESGNNNSQSSANGPLCNGTTLSGSINNRRDTDWFYFDVNSPSDILVSLNHHHSDDFDWRLYQSSGQEVASAETTQVPETGTYTASIAGRYYLRVIRYAGSGWYDLDVSFNSGGGSGGGNDCGYGTRPSKPGGLTRWITVQPGQTDTDQCPPLSQAAVLLMGGNYDVDEAFSSRVKPLVEGGDVVVLRTSGSDAYNDVLLQRVQANSVETIIVDTRNKANSDYVEWAVRSAEFVFVAGGDQSDYLNQWQGTKVEAALNHVVSKGGVLGGTSAGNAIQGELVYDPDGVPGIYSSEAVSDACHSYLHLSHFLSTPFMQNIVTDTHFAQRDRMGRLAVFMADGGANYTGIGVDEDTSIFIRADGTSVVDGDNAVYVLRQDNQTQQVQFQCGSPVIISNLRRYKLQAGDTFNFTTGSSSAVYSRLSIDGTQTNFYSPSNPY